MEMLVIAGFLLILIGFIIVLSAARMIENEVKKGKKTDNMVWVLFSGIALFSVVAIGAGIYFVVLGNR
jgi:O-antigen/teichoic acid export membrane protein